MQCVVVLQYVVVCCNVLQREARSVGLLLLVYMHSIRVYIAACFVLQCAASVLQCVAVCCSVLQCVAVCCDVL